MQRRLALRQSGIVLVALLLAMMFSAVLAMIAAESWATTVRRERETELLFIGRQYRLAIRSYYLGAPGGQARVFPAQLEDLLEDKRYPVPVHHLRRLYLDPLTGSADWGLVQVGDRISGVYSKSTDKPMKQTGFDPSESLFEARDSFKDWAFVFIPPVTRRR